MGMAVALLGGGGGLYRALDARLEYWSWRLLNAIAGEGKGGTASAMRLASSSGATHAYATMQSPTIPVLILCTYLFVVCVGKACICNKARLKPYRCCCCCCCSTKNKDDDEPFAMKLFVILHNVFCILLSSYLCFGILLRAISYGYSLWGNAYKEYEKEMAFFIHLFYMSKLYELIDTIIMLLKRNTRQITFLHVFHHCSVVVIWWVIAKYAPGGDAYFSAAMNSAVHVLMYVYYLLSSLLRNHQQLRRRYLFWGKYLTWIQMLQFAVNMAQASYCLGTQAPYPKFLCQILLYYMISLLFLFSNFYVNKYSDKICKIGWTQKNGVQDNSCK